MRVIKLTENEAREMKRRLAAHEECIRSRQLSALRLTEAAATVADQTRNLCEIYGVDGADITDDGEYLVVYTEKA